MEGSERDYRLHFGLDVAETKAALQISNYQMLTKWAINGILNFKIPVGSRNYETLLDAPGVFEVTDKDELQEYYDMILEKCKKNE